MLDVRYAAGFFDGEGCVIVGKNFQVASVLAQSELEILKEFQAMWGGFIYEQGNNKLAKKPHWHWRLSRKAQTQRFLQEIRPFCRVKVAKIDLALEMLKLLQATEGRKQMKNGKFIAGDKTVKQDVYDRFKALNG